MMKKINELRKNEKGFTLIELIIVIAILAIIAAVAVPNIIGAVDNSRRSADVANAKIILNAAVQVQASNSQVTVTGTDITEAALDTNAAADSFEEALFTELNGTIPEPRLQGTNFVLVVNAGNISVTLDDGTVVAPNPDADYDQQ